MSSCFIVFLSTSSMNLRFREEFSSFESRTTSPAPPHRPPRRRRRGASVLPRLPLPVHRLHLPVRAVPLRPAPVMRPVRQDPPPPVARPHPPAHAGGGVRLPPVPRVPPHRLLLVLPLRAVRVRPAPPVRRAAGRCCCRCSPRRAKTDKLLRARVPWGIRGQGGDVLSATNG